MIVLILDQPTILDLRNVSTGSVRTDHHYTTALPGGYTLHLHSMAESLKYDFNQWYEASMVGNGRYANSRTQFSPQSAVDVLFEIAAREDWDFTPVPAFEVELSPTPVEAAPFPIWGASTPVDDGFDDLPW